MRLIAYKHRSETPVIRPAPARRDWMDRTVDRFAYRCLPLTIGNAHGWDLLCPYSIEAIWTGSPAHDGVKVVAFGEARQPLAGGHFGEGVLTFTTGYVFRTEPSCALYVSGPTNVWKDGIVALTGVVETEWLPYGFTMNWAFTRPGVAVRFEEGEPFCTVFPVRLDEIEAVEPEVRDISSDPDAKRRYEQWSASRDAWIEDRDAAIKENRPRKEAWQRFYTRGTYPDGTCPVGAPHHRTRLQLHPFVSSAPTQGTIGPATGEPVLEPLDAALDATPYGMQQAPEGAVDGLARTESVWDVSNSDSEREMAEVLMLAPSIVVEDLAAEFVIVRAQGRAGAPVRLKLARAVYDLLRRFSRPTSVADALSALMPVDLAAKYVRRLEAHGLLVAPSVASGAEERSA